MHRIFAIPELLDSIFGLLDRRSNLANVLVCRQWCDVCQIYLWRELDTLAIERLFGVLSFLDWDDITGMDRKVRRLKRLVDNPDSPTSQVFRELPRTRDWQTFGRLSNLVRVIKFDGTSMEDRYDDLFKTFAVTKPPLTNFFPNLHTLEWTDEALRPLMENISPFMLPHVKNLTITVPRIPAIFYNQIDVFFDLIASRMPGLRNLDLRCDDMSPTLAQYFRDGFGKDSLQSLEKIEIPHHMATTETLKMLSRLPRLAAITCPQRPILHLHPATDHDDYNLDLGLSERAFPTISTLTLVRTITSVLRFLDGNLPATLQKLCIETIMPESPASTRMLLERAAEIRPPLSGFQLSDVSALIYQTDQPPIVPLGFDSLKPLTMFSNLKSVRICHHSNLVLIDSNIEELTSALPLLESCVLNHKPLIFKQSETIPTMNSIYSFARNCPNIRTLGLYFDAIALPIHTEPSPRFQALRSLLVGASPIASAPPVAILFSRILPNGCKLETLPFADVWLKVKDVLPSLISLRMQEEERTRHVLERIRVLEAEVELLRKTTGLSD